MGPIASHPAVVKAEAAVQLGLGRAVPHPHAGRGVVDQAIDELVAGAAVRGAEAGAIGIIGRPGTGLPRGPRGPTIDDFPTPDPGVIALDGDGVLEDRVGAAIAVDDDALARFGADDDRGRGRAVEVGDEEAFVGSAEQPDRIARLDGGGLVQCRLQIPGTGLATGATGAPGGGDVELGGRCGYRQTEKEGGDTAADERTDGGFGEMVARTKRQRIT